MAGARDPSARQHHGIEQTFARRMAVATPGCRPDECSRDHRPYTAAGRSTLDRRRCDTAMLYVAGLMDPPMYLPSIYAHAVVGPSSAIARLYYQPCNAIITPIVSRRKSESTLTRRGFLRYFMTVALAARAGGLRVKPAGARSPVERRPSELVVHKGWVFRRTDLRDDVRIAPVSSNAL
jgi:hypothetical protein